MAILKQNGPNGKIMRTPGDGKVLKQNYNFGKAFKNNVSGVYDINIPFTSNLKNQFTVLFWFKDINASGRNEIFFTDSADPSLFVIRQGSTLSSLTAQLQYNNINSNIGKSTKLYGFTRDLDNFYRIYDNVFDGPVNSSVDTVFSKFIINSNADGGKFSYCAIYNRIISKEEHSFLYNNGLGNEHINQAGLVRLYKFNLAEILNNGSGDFVGIRDESGENVHAKILNLPAGTLQEQVDYANANLFETW